MLEVKELLRRLAPSPLPILLLGSTGTGKGLVADVIHAISGRPGPLEAFNCGTFSRDVIGPQLFGHRRGAFTGAVADSVGAIERAHRGTLFLDEVADLPGPVQAALLTVIEDGKYLRLGDSRRRHADFRLVAATNKPIDELVRQGMFREDLYFRLRGCTVRLPDLADRGEDVLHIADALIRRIGVEEEGGFVRLSDEAREMLLDRDWPGNVRDLDHALHQAVMFTDRDEISATAMGRALENVGIRRLTETSARSGSGGLPTLAEAREEGERNALRQVLAATGDDYTEAARILGVSRRTLYRKRKEHGLG